jgi:hypothetical protein
VERTTHNKGRDIKWTAHTAVVSTLWCGAAVCSVQFRSEYGSGLIWEVGAALILLQSLRIFSCLVGKQHL